MSAGVFGRLLRASLLGPLGGSWGPFWSLLAAPEGTWALGGCWGGLSGLHISSGLREINKGPCPWILGSAFKLHISTFKDLILNVVFVIIVSLTFLIFFQFALNPENLILFDVIEIGTALSFSGFISVPLVLFIFHNLVRNSLINENLGYSLTLIIWILTSQIFL